MRPALVIGVALALAGAAHAGEPTSAWFKSRDCGAVAIVKRRSLSKHEVTATVTIEDAVAVRRLMERIEKIPRDGATMVKPGPDADHLELAFRCGAGTQTVEFINRRIKTPSTGFHDEDPIGTSLYADLDALLLPDFGKRVLKIAGLTLRYKAGFTVTFVGKLSADAAPATVQVTRETYEIKDRRGPARSLEVASGQTPPGPAGFVANNVKLRLLTYESSRGERLYPDYFEVAR